MNCVDALLPSREVINGAFREKQSAYPINAFHEAIANALIHHFLKCDDGHKVFFSEEQIGAYNSKKFSFHEEKNL